MTLIVFGQARPLPPPRSRPPRRAAFVAPLAAALLVALTAFGCARGAWGAEPAQDAREGVASAATPLDALQSVGGPPATNVAPLPTATPAPAFTATAEPVRVAPSSRGGRESVADIIARYFPAEPIHAIAVATCESSLDPAAHSPYGYQGIYQIDPGLHAWRLVAIFGGWRSLYDAETNVAVAAHIVAELGWQPWPVCRYAGGSGGW